MLRSHGRLATWVATGGAALGAAALVAVLSLAEPAVGAPVVAASPTDTPTPPAASATATPTATDTPTPPAASAPATPTATDTLTPAAPTAPATLSTSEVALVNSVGSVLSTKPGSVVSVVRGPGQAIWDAVSPGTWALGMTPDVMSHDFLFVTCTDNPDQMGYKGVPGVPDPVIGETEAVIDTVTGRVLMNGYIPKGQTDTSISATALSHLMAPTTMSLSATSFG